MSIKSISSDPRGHTQIHFCCCPHSPMTKWFADLSAIHDRPYECVDLWWDSWRTHAETAVFSPPRCDFAGKCDRRRLSWPVFEDKDYVRDVVVVCRLDCWCAYIAWCNACLLSSPCVVRPMFCHSHCAHHAIHDNSSRRMCAAIKYVLSACTHFCNYTHTGRHTHTHSLSRINRNPRGQVYFWNGVKYSQAGFSELGVARAWLNVICDLCTCLALRLKGSIRTLRFCWINIFATQTKPPRKP